MYRQTDRRVNSVVADPQVTTFFSVLLPLFLSFYFSSAPSHPALAVPIRSPRFPPISTFPTFFPPLFPSLPLFLSKPF